METQELTLIEKSSEVIKSGGTILAKNIDIANKAVAVGNSILEQIQAEGGINTPELDKRANDYIARCKARKSEMNEERKGVTQILDEIKKAFTEQENKLDASKEGTAPYAIQQWRNSYAKKVAEEERKKREEAEHEAIKKQEQINVKAKIEVELIRYFENYISVKKLNILDGLNNSTLQDIDLFEKRLLQFNPETTNAYMGAFKIDITSILLTSSEINTIKDNLLSEMYERFKYKATSELSKAKEEVLGMIPSKRVQLQEQEAERIKAEEEERLRQEAIAKADGEKRAKLEEEARIARIAEEERLAAQKAENERIAKEDAERIAHEAEESKKQAELKAQLDREAEATQVLFEKEVALQSETSAPETRCGYNIVITHQAGFAQVFMFWWENEGVKLPLDKIANTKISQMVTYCEKYAQKYGTKLESQYVKYEDNYTAINRKSK